MDDWITRDNEIGPVTVPYGQNKNGTVDKIGTFCDTLTNNSDRKY